MASNTYASPIAGLPSQTALHTGRAVFTEAYALIPHGVMRDIVTSYLPHWKDTRAWVIARPMTGFAETFSQYIMEVFPGGGSQRLAAKSIRRPSGPKKCSRRWRARQSATPVRRQKSRKFVQQPIATC